MGSEERYKRGLIKRREMMGPEGDASLEALQRFAPDLARWMVEFVYGEVYQRPGLDFKTRTMCTLAALTVLGREPQLRNHLGGARRAGISKEEIVELLMQMAIYGGLPATLNAIRLAQEVYKEA